MKAYWIGLFILFAEQFCKLESVIKGKERYMFRFF